MRKSQKSIALRRLFVAAGVLAGTTGICLLAASTLFSQSGMCADVEKNSRIAKTYGDEATRQYQEYMRAMENRWQPKRGEWASIAILQGMAKAHKTGFEFILPLCHG